MAASERSCDDVIRIRVDSAWAVEEFERLLAEQAAEGETRAPANPPNRAIFRELAPFRLLEYEYVDEEVGGIEGVYLGFPDGAIHAVSDEIPEEVVDRMLTGPAGELPPVYVYVLPRQPLTASQIDRFLKALSAHLNKPLVGVFRDERGQMSAHAYDGDVPGAASPHWGRLEAGVVRSVLEANRHLTKARVLDRFAARSQGPDGRAYALLTYGFAKHIVEFASVAERDDFLAWTRFLCQWIYARSDSWGDMGFGEVLRPAQLASAPVGDQIAVRLAPPARAPMGNAWRAFGGTSAATARPFAESEAATSDEALAQALITARAYWSFVTETVATTEAHLRAQAEAQRKRVWKD